MKLKTYFLLLVISLFSISLTEAKQACSTQNCSDVNNSSCQCYCSFKCGYREKVPGQDKPRWNTDRCWCAHRDETHYTKNHCGSIDRENGIPVSRIGKK